jgi:hypothetical protein
MNPNHRFWLLRIIKNVENKEIITIIKKIVNTIYKGIRMNKTTNCECCKYF